MIGLLKRATLSPAEEVENKRLVKEIMERRNPLRVGKEWRVALDHDNPSSHEEYPHKWVGIEQERERDCVLLRFPKEFVGKNEKGQRERKTKKRGHHLHTMWVPLWLLKEFAV